MTHGLLEGELDQPTRQLSIARPVPVEEHSRPLERGPGDEDLNAGHARNLSSESEVCVGCVEIPEHIVSATQGQRGG